MVNNLGFRWPTPLFFMVLGAHDRVYNRFLVAQIYGIASGDVGLCGAQLCLSSWQGTSSESWYKMGPWPRQQLVGRVFLVHL